MAKQTVNIGAALNDQTGDPLRTAYTKINDNTDEIYNALGDGTDLNAVVSKVGTPADNQVGVWTGDGTIEGDANLTYDATNLTVATGAVIARQVADETTTTFRRIRPTESGYSYEMNNAAANTIELLGDKSFSITGATQANPVVITVASTLEFETGDSVEFSSVGGMVELNGNTYTITVLDGTTFSLDATDGTGFTAYTSGGFAERSGLTYPLGFFCEIIQTGAGTTTLEAGAFVQLNGQAGSPGGPSGDLTGQYAVVTLRNTNSGWIANGDIGAIS